MSNFKFEDLKTKYDKIRASLVPGKRTESRSDFIFDFVVQNVLMEGSNKATKDDIKKVIEGKKTNLKEREINEILNLNEAIHDMFTLVEENRVMDEEKMKDYHQILMKNIMNGGLYRNVNIQILGGIHQPPAYLKVYPKMDELEAEMMGMPESFDKAVYVHARLAKIHPFVDGNGRHARLMLIYFLLKAGITPINIPVSKKAEYIKKLEIYKSERNIKPLSEFFEDLVVERYNELIKKYS